MKKTTLLIVLLLFISKINAQDDHPIVGTWELKTVVKDGKTKQSNGGVFIFDKGGVLKAAQSLSGGAITVGKWKCDKKRKMLVLESTMDKDFNGEAKVLKLKDGILSYKKDGVILNFSKAEMAKPDNTPIPALKFTTDDFITKDGDDKYLDDGAKLPWTIEQIYENMKNVKEMVYHVDHFEPGRGKTDSWTNSFKVKFHSDNELGIREYSNTRNDYIDMDDGIFPLNEDTAGQMIFFPQAEPGYFRYVGTEKVKTPAGTFDCTVIEGIGDFDLKLKYWMINDKPGVYAKIIKSKEDGFSMDYTNVYTLTEIK